MKTLKQQLIYTTGHFGEYGGRYIPEALMPMMLELEQEFYTAIKDPQFKKELKHLHNNYTGRPTPLTFLGNLTKELGGAKLYLKNEGLLHTGAHKINHCLGQALIAKRLGKKRLIAETGAGQHGVATATVAAKFGFECTVYMGSKDYKRQRPNVFYMEMLGATVIPVEEGGGILKDAISAALKDLITNPEDSHYLLGTVCGPHPYPAMNTYFQKIIGEEVRKQIRKQEGKDPDKLIACIGGGSNAIGLFYEFLDDKNIGLIGVEAGGSGVGTRLASQKKETQKKRNPLPKEKTITTPFGASAAEEDNILSPSKGRCRAEEPRQKNQISQQNRESTSQRYATEGSMGPGDKGSTANFPHAARFQQGTPGVVEGFKSYFLQHQGQIGTTSSISAGLDYAGVGPQHSYLHDIKRLQPAYATDSETLKAYQFLVKTEGIFLALESSHAMAEAIKQAPKMKKNQIIVVNGSGRGDKDLFITTQHFDKHNFNSFLTNLIKR
jgi:tryptophan synthase beta subunit